MSRPVSPAEPFDPRTRPLVWVKRIVLYESIDPPQVIRQVEFSTGLNIIQGVVEESDEDFQSGHGTGKTTLCRLIRYCLGENSFGQKHVAEEVKHAFPDGYVGAEVELNGSVWAILRPLGRRNRAYASDEVGLDDLPKAPNTRRFESFTEQLASEVLADLRNRELLSNAQPIDWLHVLAMCSRDQETRYDRFWNWRDPRSDSGTPRFAKPKVDAGLCVRSLMGLIDPSEPELRKALERLDDTLNTLRSEIKAKHAEPTYNINRLRISLTTDFGIDVPEDAPLDDGDLHGLPWATHNHLEALQQEVDKIDSQLAPLDRQISIAAASLLEPQELAEQQQAAAEVTAGGNTSLLQDIEQKSSLQGNIRDAQSSLCQYGGVMIGECRHVQERIPHIDGELEALKRSSLPTVAGRDQTIARMTEQTERMQATLERIRSRLDELHGEKNDLLESRRNLNDLIRRLPAKLSELQRWNAILEGNEPNTDIRRLEGEAAEVEAEIASKKTMLARLLSSRSRRLERLKDQFDAVVRETLTGDYRGEVKVEEDGVGFGIRRGESLSGEAYETLAVLLADLALLLDNTSGDTRHPGILLHDSPREADLNLQIYQRMLDMADRTMRPPGQEGDVPYQYIVTTTTPPSQRLRDASIIRLMLGGGEHSLFGRQLEAPSPLQDGPSLFDED